VKLAAKERIASKLFGCSFNDVLKAANANGSCSFFALNYNTNLFFNDPLAQIIIYAKLKALTCEVPRRNHASGFSGSC
jgi:hypothetical protein